MALPGTIVQNPTFNPATAIIIAITQAEKAVIQTNDPHTFVVGQSVKIIVPKDYGMEEINGLVGNITFISSLLPNFFQTDINSQFFSPFAVPANPLQFAQAVPVGEDTFHLDGAERNVLTPI